MDDVDPLALVCTLPAGVRSERRGEIQTLLETRTAFTLHPDGIELVFKFSEQAARMLLDFVFFERQCCNSFQYELSFSPPHDGVTLRLRAPAPQVAALQTFYQDLPER
jgi:hypothetical protein